MAKTIFSSPSQHNQLFVPAAKQKAAQIYPPIFAHYRNHKGISTGTTSKQQGNNLGYFSFKLKFVNEPIGRQQTQSKTDTT